MSYTLHLWNADDAQVGLGQVGDLLQALRGRRPEVAARRFEQCLTLIHAHYGVAADQELPEVWSEQPLPSPHALWVLGVNSGELDRALPVIHAAAAECGLVCYDGQADALRWPDGQVEDRGGRRHEAAPPMASLALNSEFSDSNAASLLRQQLAQVLQGLGFQPGRGEWWFEKNTPTFKIYLLGRLRWDHFSFWMPVYLNTPRGRPELEKYCEAWSLDLDFAALAARHGLAFTALFDNPTHQLPAGDWAQVRASAAQLCAFFQAPPLAFLGDLDTLEKLDHWANRVPDEDCPFRGLRGRTVANKLLHLSNNADLLLAHLAERVEFLDQTRERMAASRAGDTIAQRGAPLMQRFVDALGVTL